MKRFYSYILPFFLVISHFSFGQLTVTDGLTAQQLAENLSGPNITVFNASLTGGSVQSGTFNYTGTNFEIGSGVMLTSGKIVNAIGPNNSSSTSWNNYLPGTAQMDAVAGVSTFDAVTLKFDFTVQSSSIKFDYIFASEEYNEYVGSNYNDVFAFYISGPGINGEENIALVPNTTDAVTINNINLQNYWQYFRNNTDGNTNIQFDGFTSLLTAKKDGLIPCNTYTLKLVIADAGDGVWDSGVFLRENSLVQESVSVVTNTVTQDQIALEGCYDASFTFNLDKPQATNTTISYLIEGTAINGVDYKKIDSSIIIPAGQISATVIIDAYADGIPEVQEIVELKYRSTPCADYSSVILYINDNQPIDFSLSKTDLQCYGDKSGQINAAITGGFGPYKLTLNDEATYNSLPITGLNAGTYVVKVDDKYGCGGEAKVVGAEFDAGTTFLPDGNGEVYTSLLPIAGFGASETLTSANQLQSICLTLEHSFMGDIEMKLIAPDGKAITLKERPGGNNVNFGEPVASGPVDTQSENTTPGKGYQYCFSNTPVYGTMVSEANNNYTYNYIDNAGNQHTNEKYLPSGGYQPYQSFEGLVGAPLNGNWTIWVKDHKPNDNGYIFKWSISFTSNHPGNVVIINQPQPISINGGVTKAACGTADGAINITATGQNAPFTYAWSNGATTEDINSLAAGSYTVTVKDKNNCTSQSTFLVSNASALTINATTTNVSCYQNTDGAIDVTVNNGSGNYIYQWSNGATTEDITNLSTGNYTISAKDNTSGCVALASVSIAEPEVLKISSTIFNEKCGDREGSISIQVSGGNGNYQYTWSNNATTSAIQNLQAGNYSVTVQDSKGCSLQKTFTVINEVGNCIPFCDLAIVKNNVINEACGHSNGSIDISITTTNGPYSFSWSNGALTEDLSSLKEGDYSIAVKDKVGCSATQSFTISNSSGTLSAGIPVISNEKCGDGKGQINISPSGGNGGYSFLWSNGATTEDISNLNANTYSVLITDNANCSISASFEIANESGTLQQTYGNTVNETCSNGRGSIDITIKGGNTPYTYTWSNGSASQDLINLSSGTYSCTIKDATGCSISTPNYTIKNETGNLKISFIDIDNELCDNNKGAIELYVSGGIGPYSYTWSNNVTATPAISNLSEGNYSCIVSDFAGCAINTGAIALVNESGTLQIDNIFTQHEECGNGAGAIDVVVSGGNEPYSYQWSNGATIQDLNALHTGTYSCIIRDSQGCSTNVSALVNNTSGTLAVSNVTVTNDTCGTGTGAIDLTIQGGTTPYVFLWSNGATTEDITNQKPGIYTYKVTDKNGCFISSETTIQGAAPALEKITILNETCGLKNGSVELKVTGGTENYIYTWSNGATSNKITQLAAGTYTCLIKDGNNCTLNTPNIIVNGNSGNLMVTVTTTTNTFCHSATIQLNITGGTGPFKYQWSTGETTQNIIVSKIGTFSCIVTDANGLCASASTVINDLGGSAPAITFYVYDDYCGTGKGRINLYVSGGPYTFLWSNGKTTQNIDKLSEGTYTCLISSYNGCKYSVTATVKSLNSNPLKVQTAVTSDICGKNQGSIDLTVSGGTPQYYYDWYDDKYNYLGSMEDINGLKAGKYYVYVFDETYYTSYCYLQIPVTVTGNTALNVSTQITNDNCGKNAGAINLTVTGGQAPYNFLWSNNSTTEDITNVDKGIYTFNVTDVNNCSLQSTAEVTGYDPIVISNIVTPDICLREKGAIDITVSGGTSNFSYLWNDNSTTQDISNVIAGDYSVTVTDLTTNCNEIASYTISNFTNGFAIQSLTPTNENCGDASGSIDLTMTGGSNHFTYLWNNQQTTQDINNLKQGNYTVTVTDSDLGCTETKSVYVNNETGSLSQQTQTSSETCGNNLGSIDLSVTGGSGNYLFAWSNGSTSEDIINLNAGTYSCDITDLDNNCIIHAQANIQHIENPIIINAKKTVDDICGQGKGELQISVTGGIGNFSYLWSNNNTQKDINQLPAGDYTVTVNSGSCTSSKTFTVSNNDLGFDINFSTTNEKCGNGTGSIILKVTGGSGVYSYQWNNNQNTQNLTSLHEGTYSVIVRDNIYGCSVTKSISVENDANPLTYTTALTDDVCDLGKGKLKIIPAGGTGEYSFKWSTGSTLNEITHLKSGIYSCEIKDLNSGCKLIVTEEVKNRPNNLFINLDKLVNENCGDGKGEIQISTSGGYGNIFYSWSNGSRIEDLHFLHEGTYSIIVSDDEKCTNEKSFTVSNIAPFSISNASITDATCVSCNNGEINLTMSETGLYTYNWSNGKNTEDISDLLPGNYRVTIAHDETDKSCMISQNFTIGVTPEEIVAIGLYPNPSLNGIFFLENKKGEGHATVTVTDMLGQKVYSGTIPFTTNKVTLDFSLLANGTYNMEIAFGTEKTSYKILISK